MGIGNRINDNEEAKSKPQGTVTSKSAQDTQQEPLPEEIFVPVEPKFAFDDIILPARVREQILNAADYAENSKVVFEDWGLSETHKLSKRIGINLYGEPGTGKTMAAHAIAKHLKRKIIVVNYADIESKYVGETPKNIRKVFEAGKKTSSIIFFDEADAILSRRVTNMSNATDVSVNQTRSVMLMLMNEYQEISTRRSCAESQCTSSLSCPTKSAAAYFGKSIFPRNCRPTLTRPTSQKISRAFPVAIFPTLS